MHKQWLVDPIEKHAHGFLFFSACEQDRGPQGLPKAPFFKSPLNGVGPPGTSKDNCFSSSLWMGLGHRCLGCSWGLPNDVLRSRFAGLRGLRPRFFFFMALVLGCLCTDGCLGCSSAFCWPVWQANRATVEAPHGPALPWLYKASPHTQAGPQRPQKNSTWVCFVMAVAGRPAHSGRPKEPPESFHMGLLCHGLIREPRTQAGPRSPQRGSTWVCFAMALQGRRTHQGAYKVIRKGVSLEVPGGPNHAKGNSKKGVLESPRRPKPCQGQFEKGRL